MPTVRRIIAYTLLAPFVLVGLCLLALVLWLVLGRIVSAHRFNSHSQEWTTAISSSLPPGTSVDAATAFFFSRGVEMNCRTRSNSITECGGRDYKSFGALPSWSLHFTVVFKDGKLVEAKSEAYGLGL